MYSEEEKQAQMKKDMESLRILRPIDDGFMRCMFKDNLPLVQFVLRIIMGRPELIVTSSETQKDLKRLAGSRSLELDVYAEELDSTKYDVEIERRKDRVEPHRARYHQSAMDVESLRPGEDFSMLPESYIIFLTEKDTFGKGKPFYRIERMNLDTGEPFDDGEHILYVNGAYRDDSDFGKLMHDFCCNNAKDMYLEPMAERTRYLKESQKGVEEMCKVFEDILNEGMEKGMEKGMESTLLSNLKSLMEKLGYTVEQAMDVLNVSPEVRARLIPQL